MKRKIVKEWLYKAEEDYEAAISLARKRKRVVPDAVCFHCQQCIEKYLKAFLLSEGVEPPAIHDLQSLRMLCSQIDKEFDGIKGTLDILNAYAVNFRYPGEEATIEESKEAVCIMRRLKDFIVLRMKRQDE